MLPILLPVIPRGKTRIEFTGMPDGALTGLLSGATWAISGGKLINTPTASAEMLTNPGFEGTYSGGVAPNWTKTGSPTVAESADAHGGVASQSITNTTGVSNSVWSSTYSTIKGEWYRFFVWNKHSGTAANPLVFLSNIGLAASQKLLTIIPSATYQKTVCAAVGVNTASGNVIKLCANVAGGVVLYDDASLVALTKSTLFAAYNFRANVSAAAKFALTSGDQGGLVLRLDNPAAPTNFVYCYHDGTQVHLVSHLNGTTAELFAAATVTYQADYVLRCKVSGTSYAVYYGPENSETLINTATLDNAAINSNSYCGLYATDPGVQFKHFLVERL